MCIETDQELAALRAVGAVVRRAVEGAWFSVVRALAGHGIGRTIHEDPRVPNWDDPTDRDRLVPGLVLTVEPIIAAGSGDSFEAADGWTIRTRDGSLAAHAEHTHVIARGAPILRTAA